MKATETLTWKDIQEIPALLDAFSKTAAEKLNDSALKADDESVHLIGRGSSGNATLFAKYIWETYAGVYTDFIHPHAIFEAKYPLKFDSKAVWAFSQSGQSTDVIECLKKLMSWGAKGVAVTNEPDISKNPLATAANRHILLSNSKENAVAATKTFALQLWLVLWTAHVWRKCFTPGDFKDTSGMIAQYLKNPSILSPGRFSFWDEIKSASEMAFVGRGPFYGIATDAALKFREMAGVHAAAYSAAEFLHGPIGAHGAKDLVFLLSPSAHSLPEDLEKVRKALKERSTAYHIITPAGGEYPFNSIITDIELKIAALLLAVEKGLNPDSPKGLKKVTETF